jgi:energy-coupling factor transporter transmembrane protein EcfT
MSKILVVVILSTASFFGPGRLALYACLCVAALIGVIGGAGRAVGKASVGVLVIVILEYLLAGSHTNPFLSYVAGFLHTMLRMAPPVLLGVWLAATLRVSDFLAAADRLRFPRALTIVLGVTLRYLPTIAIETSQIRMALRTRDLRPGVGGFIRRPLRSIHLHLVPLLFRSLVVADELSAAALTRGLDRPGRRTHIRASVFTFNDAAFVLGTIAFSVLVVRFRVYV